MTSATPTHQSAVRETYDMSSWHIWREFVTHMTRRVMTSATPTMGWLRLVGSLKLQDSFAEYSLFYRALLQKRPILSRSLLIVATPYHELQTPLLNFTKRGPTLLKEGLLLLYSSRFLNLRPQIKLYVSFAKNNLFFRALLQKRPIILGSLLIVATPYFWTAQDVRTLDRRVITVSFAKNNLFYRALLQKRPMILGSLLISAPWTAE